MLKNSKTIKFISFGCYVLSLVCLAFLIVDFVQLKGQYMTKIAEIVGLGAGVLAFAIIGVSLAPLKIFKSENINLIFGFILCLLAGATLGFCVYNCIVAYNLKMLLICLIVFVLCTSLGVFLLKVAKQDININARKEKEKKEQEVQAKAEREAMTNCPYCNCRITKDDVTCPNCKSKL